MTAKYDAFITELDALCKKHDVYIDSCVYDQPAVWDGYEPEDICRIRDETNEMKGQNEYQKNNNRS